MSKLGDLLKNHRIENNLSLRDFSKQIGISHAYLNKIEKGTDPVTGKSVAPTINTLLKISKAIDIEIEELLEESGYIENQDFENIKISTKIDIENYFDDFIRSIKKSDAIIYRDKILGDSEIEKILNGFIIAFEISLKNI